MLARLDLVDKLVVSKLLGSDHFRQFLDEFLTKSLGMYIFSPFKKLNIKYLKTAQTENNKRELRKRQNQIRGIFS